ncbi:MAG: MFS transporter [Planctomycetota bacterium]
MDDGFLQKPHQLSWRFPATFWFANGAELFERAAFYGMFIALSVYLTRNIGFSDIGTGIVSAGFACVLYLLPTFMGALADRIGFRRALLLAFALLTVGYALLGLAGHSALAGVGAKLVAVVSLAVIMFGGAMVKPVISGTVAKCSDAEHRARAFSIFYFVVNIGAFTGKSLAAPLRTSLGMVYVNYYAAAMAGLALLWVAAFYRNIDGPASRRTLQDLLAGLSTVVRNFRFMSLILVVAGFWALQGQLYASMPKYVLRMVGETAKPEWLANINPAVVVLLVVPVTHLVRRVRPENSIAIGIFMISCSMLCIGLSSRLESVAGHSVSFFGGWLRLHPVTVVLILGIALQGFAECFLSPKFLEYASKQAPPGQEGLYMGYQYLTTSAAWALGFVMSGFLLNAFCPDPQKLAPDIHAAWQAGIASGAPLPQVYAHAHYIWYVFCGIGALALVALLVFKLVTNRIDQTRTQ